MAAISRVFTGAIFTILLLSLLSSIQSSEETQSGDEPSEVLILEASNFSDTISKHPFVVVEFYAPWCGHCKRLTPEYEKAALTLSKNDPPIVLAKVDANEELNKELASQYDVRGFPTLKILRNGGKNIQEYKGPREADGIVEYLKKQAGPASSEIKSAEDAGILIDDKKVFIVGIFPSFSGEEFENFVEVAEKLRSDYDFGHTSDSKILPRGDLKVAGPLVRLFKPFDELVADFQDFDASALQNFIEVASVPVVTTYNKDPANHPFVIKFFNSPNAKAMLFVNFSSENIDAFKSKYHEVAVQYKGNVVSFLIGDVEAAQGAFQYFGLNQDQVPLVVIQNNDGQKFLKTNVDPSELAPWLKAYKEGSVAPYKKSQPIPEDNTEPVKVVVADNLHDVVFKSGKNVLLEFFAPWCGHCKKLAPILDEVAVSFQNDPDVIIAKMDATENDVPSEFEVQGYPTMYFSSAGGKLLQFSGGRTADEITDFIQKNRDTISESSSYTSPQGESAKDEL